MMFLCEFMLWRVKRHKSGMLSFLFSAGDFGHLRGNTGHRMPRTRADQQGMYTDMTDRSYLRSLSLARAAVAALIVIGGAVGAVSSARGEEALRIAVPSDPGSLDPAYWGTTVDQILIDNLFPRLAKYVVDGDSWTIELDAAKSIDMSKPQEIGFELKPGIIWTGGFGEMTADDVKFSFERHLDPDLASGVAAEFAPLDHVEVTGRYTGIIHLTGPAATFWSATLVNTSGAIVSRKAVEAAGGWFEAVPAATASAYEISDFQPGSMLALVRDPDWTGETGDFDRIELLSIGDPNAAELAFDAGEIDYFRGAAANYDALTANPPKDAEIKLVPSIDPMWVGLNMANAKLTDPRVRKAVQLAVDVPAVVQATLGDAATSATGMIAEGLPGYREGKAMTRDVEAARALLKDAGAEGLELQLSYVNTTAGETAAQVMQANLAEAGITLVLNGQDEGTYWSVDAASMSDLELTLQTWSGNPDGFYMLQYFVEDQIGVWNWQSYHSPEYDALVAEARMTEDPDQRGVLYERMQDLLADSGTFIFLAHEPRVAVWRTTIEPGFLPDGRPVFADFRHAD